MSASSSTLTRIIETIQSAMDANSTDDSDFRLYNKNPKSSGCFVLSNSGETKDVVDFVQMAQQREVPVVSVVNGVGSSIANMTKCGIYTHAGPELASTSTKVFTSQVVCMALASLWFRQTAAKERGLGLSNEYVRALADSLQRLPIAFGMLMRTQNTCRKAAKKLLSKEHCFVLGKGFGEPIAMEGALKLKEVGYLHAEVSQDKYPGFLIHGPKISRTFYRDTQAGHLSTARSR